MEATEGIIGQKTARGKIKRQISTETSTTSTFANYKSIPIPVQGQLYGKRGLDIIIGSVAFIVLAILYPIIALGIKINSSGQVVYKQKRTGLKGEVFTCYKFRTMHIVEKRKYDNTPIVTKYGDSRIFGFGNILRKTNLDELPQVINVLRGEMSLVGPRPYTVDECNYWNSIFDDFYYRYMLKPGITGYAQVSGYRGGTLDKEHMRRRLDKDLVYIEKHSILLDLKIIFKTVKQMVSFRTNAH
jgi:putative colanic acid biosynthesis UDP-glucose lipid carrier transferase